MDEVTKEQENKVLSFPNGNMIREDKPLEENKLFNQDEFNYANGAKVIIKAPDGDNLELATAIFLLEHTKHYLMTQFG